MHSAYGHTEFARFVVAAAFDAAGDEGTRMARGTILQNVFPETNTISFQNV